MSHAEQLEHETEQTRTQIAGTLDELRACMTPGHVLDQLADRMSEGTAASFARNLKAQTVNNPLPVALIGAGLAWLMFAPRGTSGSLGRGAGERLRGGIDDATTRMQDATDAAAAQAGDSVGSAAESARQGMSETADAARETAGSMAESTRQAAGQAADAMRASADSVQRTASAGYEAMADGARRAASNLSESTKTAGQLTLQSGNTVLDFCREQPMLLAGLGLAVGAMVGALFPASQTENRLMGEASDRTKQRARDLASEQYENVKQVGERAAEAAADEAAGQANKDDSSGPKQDEGRKQDAAGEAQAEGAPPTAPEQSDPEWRGQPWTAENAPV